MFSLFRTNIRFCQCPRLDPASSSDYRSPMATLADQASPDDIAADTSCARKQSIIAAANDLLEEVGLDGLTIRAILKRTGLARRAFYERFAGKDDLVLAVFDTTLEENLRLARREATDEQLASALAEVRLLDWTERLPAGMGTELGERGARMSGGQRQRLAIARAVLA